MNEWSTCGICDARYPTLEGHRCTKAAIRRKKELSPASDRAKDSAHKRAEDDDTFYDERRKGYGERLDDAEDMFTTDRDDYGNADAND